MKLTDVEGIGKIHARKLAKAGIKTTQNLLEKGQTTQNRKKLAEETGISADQILRWVHIADLVRVEGIGTEYADLLKEAGVDTARDLSRRNIKNLAKALERTNRKKKLVRRMPGLKRLLKAVQSASEISLSPHGLLAGDATIDAPPPGKKRNEH